MQCRSRIGQDASLLVATLMKPLDLDSRRQALNGSGKTTTSSTLSRLLYEMGGIKSYTISIDDFYKDVTFLPGETFADKDFESLDSIDLDLLHECLRDLADGKTVDIPLFDFEQKKYPKHIVSSTFSGWAVL